MHQQKSSRLWLLNKKVRLKLTQFFFILHTEVLQPIILATSRHFCLASWPGVRGEPTITRWRGSRQKRRLRETGLLCLLLETPLKLKPSLKPFFQKADGSGRKHEHRVRFDVSQLTTVTHRGFFRRKPSVSVGTEYVGHDIEKQFLTAKKDVDVKGKTEFVCYYSSCRTGLRIFIYWFGWIIKYK